MPDHPVQTLLLASLLAGFALPAFAAPPAGKPNARQTQQIAAMNAIQPALKRMMRTSRTSLVPGASDKSLAMDILKFLQDEAKVAQTQDYDLLMGDLRGDSAKLAADAKRVKTHAFDKDLQEIQKVLAKAPGPKGK